MAVVDDPVARKIFDVLKQGCLSDPDVYIDVSRGYEDFLHIVIVSRKFDGRGVQECDDLIWNELSQKLKPEEWGALH